ncbi:MAG: hypothetical protein O2931_05530 [Planctomycetota bacterium]|nr:hypothetical protein [Planctomycetota bacterium]
MPARRARKNRWFYYLVLHGLRSLGYHSAPTTPFFGYAVLFFFCFTGSQIVHSKEDLRRPVGVFWHDVALRSAVDDLAASQHVTIWLDRRVDPTQTVDFSSGPRPLLELIDAWAKTHGMNAGQVGSAVYFGPTTTAQKIATLERLRQRDISALPEPIRAAWQQTRTVTWETLDTPRDIVNQLVTQLGCAPPTGETIPHDLWRGSQLPHVDAAQAFTLLLANFDLTFRIDPTGRRIRWEPIPAEVRWQASYPPTNNRAIDWKKMEANFPGLRWTQTARGITLDGTVEAHESLRQILNPPRQIARNSSQTEPEQRFTLTVKQLPLEDVLQAIGKQANLELHWGTSASRRQTVSFSVQRVKLGELIQAATGDTNFRWQITDRQLQILDK